jgi:hypothetical protein
LVEKAERRIATKAAKKAAEEQSKKEQAERDRQNAARGAVAYTARSAANERARARTRTLRGRPTRMSRQFVGRNLKLLKLAAERARQRVEARKKEEAAEDARQGYIEVGTNDE